VDELVVEGLTPIVLSREGRGIGVFALSDQLRPEAGEVVEALGRLGVEVVLASGDRREVVSSVARQIGIADARAGLLPSDKLEMIRALGGSGRTVGMVGDGINDAPALAAAGLGIVIGSGTDLAKEAGDVVLVRSDLRDVVRVIQIGRRTLRTIRQNLAWALGYNLVMVPIAAGALYPVLGWTLPPAACGLAMSLSSVSVVLNSIRR
jgi:Cu+-exporting ATPase